MGSCGWTTPSLFAVSAVYTSLRIEYREIIEIDFFEDSGSTVLLEKQSVEKSQTIIS